MGTVTKTKLKDKKLWYEDTLNSIHTARELRIVHGDGTCLMYVQNHCMEEVLGGGVLVRSWNGTSIVVVVPVLREARVSSCAASQLLVCQPCHGAAPARRLCH